MKNLLSVGALCVWGAVFGALQAAAGSNKGAPHIHFETNFHDLGKVIASDSVSGSFRFKNTGNAELKVGPVTASCDCTTPSVRPSNIAPGGSGEVIYTIRLDRPIKAQRIIHVPSNDPDAPLTELTVQLDFTPLYQLTPPILVVNLPAGQDNTQTSFTITRNDGAALAIERVNANQPWVTAALDASMKPTDTSAKINVTVHRPPGPPGPYNATVQLWGKDTRQPMKTIALGGDAAAELVATPGKIYWVIPDLGRNPAAYPPGLLARKIELKSVLDHEFEIKKVSTTLKGMEVQITNRGPAKSFQLLMKFGTLPRGLATGQITIETTVASLPRMEIPLTVAAPAGE